MLIYLVLIALAIFLVILALIAAAYILLLVASIVSVLVPAVGAGLAIFIRIKGILGAVAGIGILGLLFFLIKNRKTSVPASLLSSLLGSYMGIIFFILFLTTTKSFTDGPGKSSIATASPTYIIPWIILACISFFICQRIKFSEEDEVFDTNNIVIKTVFNIISAILYGLSLWSILTVSVNFIGRGEINVLDGYDIPIIAVGSIVSFIIMFVMNKNDFSLSNLLHRKSIDTSANEE